MNLDLTDTQRLLRDAIRSFLAAEVSFDRVRELEQERSWDEPLWQRICEQGWTGVALGEARGGASGSLLEVGLVVEEFARRAAIVPVAEVLAAAWVLEHDVDGAVADELLTGMLTGGVRPVPAVGGMLRLLEGTLAGEVAAVDFGEQATHHLVAVGRPGEQRLAVVDASTAGVTTEALTSIGRTPTCVARYDHAHATVVADAAATRTMIDVARALAAVQCVGCMQEAFDQTVKYAGFREQFGKPIGSFQAVRHHCANMAMRLESARFLAYEALGAIAAGGAESQVALAKSSASAAVAEVTMLAHQIHGGNGVIEENDLYFFTLRGKERALAWGSAEECLAIAARSVGEPVDWL